MQTFLIPDNFADRNKSQRIARWCFWFLLSAALYFIVESVWPGRAIGIWERVGMAVWWSAFMTVFSVMRWDRQERPTSITIDGDAIVVKRNGGYAKLYRGEIVTVIETKRSLLRDGGLLISKRTHFKTRMLGGWIWIPQETQDYASFKNLVEIWKGPAAGANP